MDRKFDPNQLLKEVGVAPTSCFLEGQTLRGEFVVNPVDRVDYAVGNWPWAKLTWFRAQLLERSNKAWIGTYCVDLRDTPAEFQVRVSLMAECQKAIERELNVLLRECDHRAQIARDKAVQDLDITSCQRRSLKAFQAVAGLLVPGE